MNIKLDEISNTSNSGITDADFQLVTSMLAKILIKVTDTNSN